MIRTGVAGVLAGLIALQTACAPLEGREAQIAGERAMERHIARAVRVNPQLAGCGDLRKVDFRRLPPEALDRTPPGTAEFESNSPDQAETRGPFGPFSAPGDAPIVLSMLAGATGHQMVRTATSSVVWKGADGVWRVNAVHNATGQQPPQPGPPGEPQYSDEELQRMQRRVVVGRLDEDQAAALDAAMGDVCLQLQPDRVPMDIPLLGGTNDFCYGGIGGVLRMTVNGQRRIIVDGCARYVAGRIMQIVMYPRTVDSSH
tara:strand:+ start:43525 stop:44301 length:777 start_codon:yes stop_codon:yes gene_type:complete